MNFDILNFLPGWKRPLTLIVGCVLFAWHEASTVGYIMDVPDYLYPILAMFGFNALSHASKNDAANP